MVNIETWSNGHIQIIEVKPFVIKNITRKICELFNKKKTFSNTEWLKMCMTRNLSKELNRMN